MKLVIIDGQGGGMGRALVERIKDALPDQPILAVGTNALATNAMIKAGADAGATGENAVVVNCRDADVVAGPMGIVLADALMGEMSPRMAQAVGACGACKVLLPTGKCRVRVAGAQQLTPSQAVEAAVREILDILNKGTCTHG
ncbi:MAG: DUF3842 family protein [Clostridia bacterium]